MASSPQIIWLPPICDHMLICTLSFFTSALNVREEDIMRTPSPFSWQSRYICTVIIVVQKHKSTYMHIVICTSYTCRPIQWLCCAKRYGCKALKPYVCKLSSCFSVSTTSFLWHIKNKQTYQKNGNWNGLIPNSTYTCMHSFSFELLSVIYYIIIHVTYIL